MRCSPIDKDRVTRVMCHKSVFDGITDDGVTDPLVLAGKIQAMLMNVGIYVLMPNEDCVFILVPVNHVTYEVHTAIIKGPARVAARGSALEAMGWMQRNTPIKKVITSVPAYNRAADVFTRRMGFKLEGTLKDAFLKNKVLHDIKIFGLSLEEV